MHWIMFSPDPTVLKYWITCFRNYSLFNIYYYMLPCNKNYLKISSNPQPHHEGFGWLFDSTLHFFTILRRISSISAGTECFC